MKRLKIPSPPTGEKTIDGRYKVVREIGQGAAGTVYEGVQLSVDRRVAIKILHQANQSRKDYKERFSREAKAIARLSHTNCITLHDFGFSEEYDSLYMVMEFVDGVELYELIKDEMLPFQRALKISIQIAEALAHAHKHGILHRDLKPENVLVTSDDEVKVLDFGLARMLDLFADEQGRRLTAEGAIFGTPAYMSPEQCGGDLNVTVHSDIYSLGVMMFQLFQGELPFDSKEVVKILVQHTKSPPPPVTAPIPDRLKQLIAKMLEKDKAKRPSTANEVADVLRAVLLGIAMGSDGSVAPDVSQEIQRSLLSRELPAVQQEDSGQQRRTTEDGLPRSPDREPRRTTPSQRLATEDLIGQRLDGKYAIESIIGDGAMSTVFSAKDAADQAVAVKVVGRRVPKELRASERFELEAKLLTELQHPNIVGLRDFGHDERLDRLYLVMELIRGDDLSTLAELGRTSVELAMLVAQDTASALAHAHSKGIVHRDLKPSNIMLLPREGGAVSSKVLDFGLARLIDDGTRLTADGTTPGTVAYMSPEQLQGNQADAASDIHALGVILYELLAGHRPFDGKTDTRIAQKILEGNPPPLDSFVHEVPQSFSDLIQRMLSVDAGRRPRSAITLLEKLDGLHNRLGLRQFRVQHVGASDDPMSDWKLRRRVPRPMAADHTGPVQIRSTGPRPAVTGEARRDTSLDWQPNRGRGWLAVLVICLILGATIAAALLLPGADLANLTGTDTNDGARAPATDGEPTNGEPTPEPNPGAAVPSDGVDDSAAPIEEDPEPKGSGEDEPAEATQDGPDGAADEERDDDLEFIP